MEGAVKIWGEFERLRRELETVQDEGVEADQAGDEWGTGELEDAEREGRRVNGEFELAIRGYGE